MNATDKDYQRAMQLYAEAQRSLDDALAHIKRLQERIDSALKMMDKTGGLSAPVIKSFVRDILRGFR